MGGAVGMTMVGLYYPIVDKDEPEVTVVRYLDNFHVCQRKPLVRGRKQIIADTNDSFIARLIASEVQRFLDSSRVRHDTATKHPHCLPKRRRQK